MTSELTLTNVSQADFDTAEAVLIDLIRVAYPSLDLRRGTVLRDILLRPAASVYALNTDRLEDLQIKMSLTAMQENEDTIDPSAVDNILNNFGVTRNVGAKATGQVRVRVDAARQYTLSTGFQFVTLEGLVFEVTQTYIVKQDADPLSNELPLLPSDDGTYYYFILPLTGAEVGAEYSIPQGTSLDASTQLFGFVSSEAYVDFSGGLDQESISEVIARLPAAISYRALESRTSIDAKLRDHFEDTSISIQDLSSQGYGDRTQLRDKHNPMGFAVGSRVDIYARTFTTPQVVLLQKTGTRVGANTYQFTIERTEAPGYYILRSISELDSAINPELDFDSLPAIGSYGFTEVRSADGLAGTFHDIDTDNSMIETAYTVYQKSVVTVTGVPASSLTHDFKVEAYVASGLADIQTYVDGTAVRNLEADYIVRCPLICFVGVDVKAYYATGSTIDQEQMQLDLYNYINSRSFVRRLTRSELASILLTSGATRIDLGTTGMALQGIVRDAAGVTHTLNGDTLDLETIADEDSLLAYETTVFAAEWNSINVEVVAE